MVSAIFSEIRELYPNYSNGESIIIYSPDYYSGEFCGSQAIIASPPSCLIDGSDSTGWANSKFDLNYQYFIIDFITKSVSLDSFMLQTACFPPNEVIVYGSNNGY